MADDDDIECAACGAALQLPIGNVKDSYPGIMIIDATRRENCTAFVCDWNCLRRFTEITLTLKMLEAAEK